MLRVLMAGGGTAGHINPAIAIADRIKREWPDTEFRFVGTDGRLEARLIPAAGYPLTTLNVQGFRRGKTPAALAGNVKTVWRVLRAERISRKLLREFRPDIAIGTGGYVCGPVLREAARQGIPVVLHESNALPGVTVKMLAKEATAVLIATEDARRYLPKGCNSIVTGNPLRLDFLDTDKEEARRRLGLDSRPFVLSFGGSLGAAHINEAMVGVLAHAKSDGRAQYLHGTGRGGYEVTRAALNKAGVPENTPGITVKEYIDDMPLCMAAADLVICRCGAMTISELPVAGKPAILIPSPYVAENHQFHNAMTLVERDGAICVEEKDLTADRLWREIDGLLTDPARLHRMSECVKTAAIPDAGERIFREIRTILGR